jgi:exocyst complex component 3
MSAPTASAAQAVGEYLQSPDDLLKIAVFRKKLEKEKSSIDARLKAGVKEQLDLTKDSLRKLFGTRDNVQSVREEMIAIERLCTDPQNAVATFDQISRVRGASIPFRNTTQALP